MMGLFITRTAYADVDRILLPRVDEASLTSTSLIWLLFVSNIKPGGSHSNVSRVIAFSSAV